MAASLRPWDRKYRKPVPSSTSGPPDPPSGPPVPEAYANLKVPFTPSAANSEMPADATVYGAAAVAQAPGLVSPPDNLTPETAADNVTPDQAAVSARRDASQAIRFAFAAAAPTPAIVKAVKGKFEEVKHPRGKDGKFIRVGQRVLDTNGDPLIVTDLPKPGTARGGRSPGAIRDELRRLHFADMDPNERSARRKALMQEIHRAHDPANAPKNPVTVMDVVDGSTRTVDASTLTVSGPHPESDLGSRLDEIRTKRSELNANLQKLVMQFRNGSLPSQQGGAPDEDPNEPNMDETDPKSPVYDSRLDPNSEDYDPDLRSQYDDYQSEDEGPNYSFDPEGDYYESQRLGNPEDAPEIQDALKKLDEARPSLEDAAAFADELQPLWERYEQIRLAEGNSQTGRGPRDPEGQKIADELGKQLDSVGISTTMDEPGSMNSRESIFHRRFENDAIERTWRYGTHIADSMNVERAVHELGMSPVDVRAHNTKKRPDTQYIADIAYKRKPDVYTGFVKQQYNRVQSELAAAKVGPTIRLYRGVMDDKRPPHVPKPVGAITSWSMNPQVADAFSDGSVTGVYAEHAHVQVADVPTKDIIGLPGDLGYIGAPGGMNSGFPFTDEFVVIESPEVQAAKHDFSPMSEPQPAEALKAISEFKERLHPRDGHGRFARKPGDEVTHIVLPSPHRITGPLSLKPTKENAAPSDANEDWWATRKLHRPDTRADIENLQNHDGFETQDGFRIERQDTHVMHDAISAYSPMQINVYGPMSAPKDERWDLTYGSTTQAMMGLISARRRAKKQAINLAPQPVAQ